MDEIVSGGVAGIAQTIVGYPLDTIKICLVEKQPIIYRNLYQGVLSPLFGAFLVNAQTFYTYNYFLDKLNNNNEYIKTLNTLSSEFTNIFNSGFLSGLSISLIETPTELIKIRMQLANNPTYLNTMKNIGLSRLYHGFIVTCWRNGLALGLYFWSYEETVKHFENKYIGSFIGGGVAGFTCWTLPYPVDCIKSQIQADTTYKLNIRSFIKNRNLRKNLWRGYSPCALRSVLVNPFIFLTYETCKSVFFT